ncbi:MAG TPA: helix-turn-helix domain-containing protein [Candidatus Sulfotelmatobacter sp.]|nr:helix-turn-helix domain-containing protein [Candidatus Sulfotelmatobacter sp.]
MEKEISDLLFVEERGRVYRLLLESVERPLLEKVMHFTGRNQLEAARILGINRNTLRTKLNKLGIER